MKKFYAVYQKGLQYSYSKGWSVECEEKYGPFDTWEEAVKAIKDHNRYKKSYFGKKGQPTSRNPNQDEYFTIVDNHGQLYYIR